jgi:methylmalonyl-CoA mutase cobalamin-binding domain/chain
VEELRDAMAALDRDRVIAIVDRALAAGDDPLALVEGARQGLELVGKEFDDGNYFLMELMWAAEIFKDAMASVTPVIQERYGATESKGTIVLGTVAGDVHDLGKNIVKNLLECSGFTVVDLGVDVPNAKFVEAIVEHKPQVVGLSALLTAAIQEVNNTVQAITEAGLRDKVKIIVGGGIVGEVKRTMLSVDHATTNANEGTRVIAGWIASGV